MDTISNLLGSFKKAILEVSQLDAEVTELEDLLKEKKAELERKEEESRSLEVLIESYGSNTQPNTDPVANEEGDLFAKLSYVQKAEFVLKRVNRPLTVSDIVKKIQVFDPNLRGDKAVRDFTSALSSILTKKANAGVIVGRTKAHDRAPWEYGLIDWFNKGSYSIMPEDIIGGKR